MATDQEFRDLEATVATLRRDLREALGTINLWRQNGLGHLDSGSGKWRFGGNAMQLDNHGMQVQTLASGSDVIPAIYFVNRLSSDPSALAEYAYVSGVANSPYFGLALGLKNTSGVAEVNVASQTSGDNLMIGLSGLLGLSSETESLVVGQYNNWSADNRFTHSLLLISASFGDASLTGMTPGTVRTSTGIGLSNYRILLNTGSYTITLKNEDTNSIAANRFGIGSDIVMAPGSGVSLFYDYGNSNRWVCSGYWGGSGQSLTGTLAMSGDITPSQITSNQDNYSPTGLSSASVLRLSTDASRDITGISGGIDGRILLVLNVGSFDIVLKDDTTSTAANRFQLNGDVTLAADEGAFLWYDATSSRWRMAGKYSAGGGAGDVSTDVLWDALGDLAVGTGANTANNLPVGTDGYVLTADSTDLSFGIKWAPAAGGSGLSHPEVMARNVFGGPF